MESLLLVVFVLARSKHLICPISDDDAWFAMVKIRERQKLSKG